MAETSPQLTSTTPASKSRAREVATQLAKCLHGFLAGKLPEVKLAKELRHLADLLDPSGITTVVQQPVEAPTGLEVELFEFWRRAVGKPTAKLTPERRAKLRARLKDGYKPEDIRRAITNVANSPFHRGDNNNGQEYVDLTLICRNGSQLERYRDQGGGGHEPLPSDKTTPDTSSDKEARIARLQREAFQQLSAGDTDAHNRTQQEIKKLRS